MSTNPNLVAIHELEGEKAEILLEIAGHEPVGMLSIFQANGDIALELRVFAALLLAYVNGTDKGKLKPDIVITATAAIADRAAAMPDGRQGGAA